MNIFNIIILKAFYLSGLWKYPVVEINLTHLSHVSWGLEMNGLSGAGGEACCSIGTILFAMVTSNTLLHNMVHWTMMDNGTPAVSHNTGWSDVWRLAGLLHTSHSCSAPVSVPTVCSNVTDWASQQPRRMFPDPGHTGNGWQTLTHWPMQWQCLASRSGNNMLQHHT